MTPRLADRPSAPVADTPLMQQYRDIKARHPGAILFFRMGDFYEMFEDDAKLAARELGLTLTSRNNGGAAEVPLAGVPVKAATDYLRRLIAGGHKVAICEQVEDPRLAKGIVKREVVRVVTPGVVLEKILKPRVLTLAPDFAISSAASISRRFASVARADCGKRFTNSRKA